MKDIKKLMITLALLLTAVGGAWAQEADYDFDVSFDHVYDPVQTHFHCMIMNMLEPGAEIKGTLDLVVDGVSKGSFDVNGEMVSGDIAALDAGNHTWSAELKPQGGGSFKRNGSFTIDKLYTEIIYDGSTSIDLGFGESTELEVYISAHEAIELSYSSNDASVASITKKEYSDNKYIIQANAAGTATITFSFAGNKNYKAAEEDKKITVTVLAPAASSGPEVDWDKDKKTGSFTMPGGNVTLEPEYYPQAALAAAPTAINDVPATTDGAIVNAGTVKNIDGTTTAQGTVMYYVSPSALDDAALLALAADAWTADVPTATHLAQGQAYVYYYVRGNDGDTDETTFSDGDILSANALTVTIAAEPTYAVTFADGTDLNEWTASPNAGVKKGQQVNVTYTGSKKVIGVKAEKKAAAPRPLAEAVAADLGKIAGADGNIYDTKAAAEAANTTAVAMIAYVGSATEHATYTHGLAIALADEGSTNWSTAKSSCEGKTAVTGAAWLLPSQSQWKTMFKANGGKEDDYTGLQTAAENAGGDGTLQNGLSFWTSTESGDNAYSVALSSGNSSVNFFSDSKNMPWQARAVLVF